MEETNVVYLNLSIDTRQGTSASSAGPVTDPEIVQKALEVQEYLSRQAALGAGETP